jgi:hypothetical protein
MNRKAKYEFTKKNKPLRSHTIPVSFGRARGEYFQEELCDLCALSGKNAFLE